MIPIRLLLLLSFVAPLSNGCARHTPAPLIPATEISRLRMVGARLADVQIAGPGGMSIERSTTFDLSDGLDEAEIVSIALTHNPKLQSRRQEIGIAQAALITAGQWPNPEVGIGLRGGIAGSSGYVTELDAIFQLFRVGEREARRQVSGARVEQARASVVAEEHALVAEVRRQRLAILAADRTVDLLQEVLTLRQRSHDLVRRQRDIGEGTELALSATELDLAEAKRALRQARGEHDVAMKDLNRLLGLPPEHLLNINGLGQPLPVALYEDVGDDELDHRLLAGRFELRAKEAAYRQAEQELRLAVLQQFPSIGLGPSFERELDGDTSLGLGLSLELPLLNQNQGEIAQKRATREQTRAEYREMLHQLRADAFAARSAVRLAKAEVESQEKEVIPVLRRSQDLFERAYRAGELNIIDWITAQQRAVNARQEHLRAFVAYRRALINLEAATGQWVPVASTHPSTQPG